jgi:pilus retraction protein PilT
VEVASEGVALNDFSDDDFSFKGVAPADPQEAAPEQPVQHPQAGQQLGSDGLLPPLPTAGSVPGGAGDLFSFEDGLPREEGEDVALGKAGQPIMGHPLGAQPEQAEMAASAAGRLEVDHVAGGSTVSVSPRHLVEGWLRQMVASNASDLILRSNGRPSQRLDGRIQFLEGQVPGPGPMLEVLEGILGARRMEAFVETGGADAALDLDGLGRFRINAYKQMGEPAIVIRRISEDAPSLDELHLPAEELKALSLRKRGLVLVTGVAGAGKSTTLSAMIEFMNRNVERHIVTLEDPIELLFKERYCVISQREVGTDTSSFKLGLKHALRQSPDVILIGEMRDADTVLAALEAIETGHLVMSTMHTVNAAQTVDRILGYFPVERHAQIRQRIADTLAGVLSMRLVPRSGGGLIPAYELMSATPQVRELLEEGKTTELGRVIETSMEASLVSMNSRLAELVQSGAVSLKSACEASDRPDELTMRLRGIHAGVRGAARAEAERGLASDTEPPLRDSSTPPPSEEGELRLRTRGR